MLSQTMTGARAAALALMLALAAPAGFALAPLAATPAEAAPAAVEALEITSSTGVVTFEVEVARTDEQRTTGLMYRKSLGERAGMLFDFKVDQPVYMWMKNTLIPLDMLFIRADGTIAYIAENTVPRSEEVIGVREPVLAVLELAGGTTRKLGIRPGDTVYHRIFKTED